MAGFVAIVRLAGKLGPQDIPGPTSTNTTTTSATNTSTSTTTSAYPDAGGTEAIPKPGEISARTLLDEMIDLDRLARLPSAGFSAGQAASTDRRSRRPEDGESWFANDDFVTETQPNLVRVEPQPDGSKRYVLLDVAGPGAIVRIWSATPAGTVRVYIDDGDKPALEAPLPSLLRGEVPPFTAPLAHVAARGHNLYFPFPFARRCLVTVDSIVSPDPFTGKPIAKLYYQIGYRRYRAEQAARVRPYSADELARAGPTIGRVARVLRNGPPATESDADVSPVPIVPAVVTPGQASVTTVPAPKGGGELTELRISTAERDPQKLRSTKLTIAFDGERTIDTP